MKRIRKSLRAIWIPTIKKDALDSLSISLGPELDVGRDDALPSRISDTFFTPCDWPLDVLEGQTWSQIGSWYNLDHVRSDPTILLQFPMVKTGCDQMSIKEKLGLSLPYRMFQERPSIIHYHEYCGIWAMFPPIETALPHVSCFVIDSGAPEDDAILLSEAEAAVALVKYQLQNGIITNHHTTPALIATLLRNQTARLTQAYFDGKRNKLVLRQSRTLDLSGPEPSPDTWTLLRWIASQPVGETRYSVGEVNPTNARGPDPTNLAPGVLPKRLLKPNIKTSYDKGTFTVKAGQLRPRQAEGVLHQIFGTERIDEDRCTDCRKGNGAFIGCCQIKERSPGCANCTYCSQEKTCRLGDPATTPSRTQSRRLRHRIDDESLHFYPDSDIMASAWRPLDNLAIPRFAAEWFRMIQEDPDIDPAVKRGQRALHVAHTEYRSGSSIRPSEFLHLRAIWPRHVPGVDTFDHCMRDRIIENSVYRGYISVAGPRIHK
ncbi:hypothetical protein BBO_01478 [Beauveria brongniartii RCEF 3172]|uniref:Uncharacterized protein n=1 Tax=Beauveria brongniartii RCEF 3172 TaxID=1081107 RepID=A0A167J6A5_9HYPO|nr:hypothetical protein BBO_01478 [Beauveria brongniartii RCEF 3172]